MTTATAVAPSEKILEQLSWRYATKIFDPTKKISEADWKVLEQSLVLSPSSYGLQPWKFFVVTNQDLKNQLVEHSWKQTQVRDASHVVVFTIRHDLQPDHVENFVKRTSEVQGRPLESLKGFQKMMLGVLSKMSSAENKDNWAKQQVYLALGFFLEAAAMLGIDACPMEGIIPAEYDKLLKISDQGYRTVVVATAGYRSSEDKYGSLPKVRFQTEDVVEYLK